MDGVIVDTEFLEYGLQTQFIENIKENDRPWACGSSQKNLSEIPEIVKKLSCSSLTLDEMKQRYFEFFKQLFATDDYRSIFRADILKIIEFANQKRIITAKNAKNFRDYLTITLLTIY